MNRYFMLALLSTLLLYSFNSFADFSGDYKGTLQAISQQVGYASEEGTCEFSLGLDQTQNYIQFDKLKINCFFKSGNMSSRSRTPFRLSIRGKKLICPNGEICGTLTNNELIREVAGSSGISEDLRESDMSACWTVSTRPVISARPGNPSERRWRP